MGRGGDGGVGLGLDELDADAGDGGADGGFEFADEIGGEALGDGVGDGLGDVADEAVGSDEVDVVGGVGVVAERGVGLAGAGGEAAGESGGGEGLEGVVDGGEAEAGVAWADGSEELVGGGVGVGLHEGFEDEFSLHGAAEAAGGEDAARVGGGLWVVVVRGVHLD